ncbi:metal-dependent transcriptional regulator [Collinsella aerofaciens]|uniref:metal-dependent transcriptional regulator n=1 Tax=Collinsella aerofaciens TaxID=74426 RepID=UPI00325BB4C8
MRGDTDASCYPRSRTPAKSSEDYLEAILVIRRPRGSYRNVDIAERLGRSKPSATKALSNLAAAGLVQMSGHDVRLTEEGERAASAMRGRHRFFERLLVESGAGAETASAEA